MRHQESNSVSRRICCVLTLLYSVLCCQILVAQQSQPYTEIGITPTAIAVHPVGNLTAINGSIPCSDNFVAETSINPGFSLWGSYVFNLLDAKEYAGFALRGIRLRASYLDLSAQYSASPRTQVSAWDDITDQFVAVETRHTATYELTYLQGAGNLEFQIAPSFILLGGVSVAFPVSGTSSEVEEIVSPTNATYLDKRQSHTIPEGSGDLSDMGMRVGLELALAYRLPLGSSLFFEPTIGADLGLTSIQPDWTPFLVRAGIGIGMSLTPHPSPAPLPVIADVHDTASTPVSIVPNLPVPFTGNLNVRAVTPTGGLIEFRREIIARYIPLLPTIFFDQDSPSIPVRYHQLSLSQTRDFSEEQIQKNAEGAHHDVLNVIGERLQKHPRARITVTGTTSRDESNRPVLADQRAQAIADYLTDIWNIDPQRISVESQLSPQIKSNGEYEEGRAENRRVEITFDNNEDLYAPVQLRVIEPVTNPQKIQFTSITSTSHPVSSWQLSITGSESNLELIQGTGTVPDTIQWNLDTEDREAVLSNRILNYSLTVADSLHRSLSTKPNTLPVRRDTSISVSTSSATPLDAAEFLLITFDFDRADLTPRGRNDLKSISKQIGPQSEVVITGYTDKLGDEAHNRALAEARARGVAALLPSGARTEIIAAGLADAPYSNDSPEGRFLNRTVRVVVRNPK